MDRKDTYTRELIKYYTTCNRDWTGTDTGKGGTLKNGQFGTSNRDKGIF